MGSIVLSGAQVIDGTGAPARRANVVVQGDRIVEITEGDGPADAERVDLSGLVLAPGFVDIHTHLDCQIFWDPDLTPSSQHGVTTVVMGNCGFTIAPMRPEHRETMIQTLENVEDMPGDALRAGIDWSFETFPEFLTSVEALPKRINVGALVGHSAVRLYVMGEDSTERQATAEEIGAMRCLVHEAIAAGALGFSTSQNSTHIGAGGKPVPSQVANAEEINEISLALSDLDKGIITLAKGPTFGLEESAELAKTTGRPVSWAGLRAGQAGPPGAALKLLDRVAELGGEVVPQTASMPLVTQLSLEDVMPLAFMSKVFSEIAPLSFDERCKLYASKAWRRRLKDSLGPQWLDRLAHSTIQETDKHSALIGSRVSDIALSRKEEPLDLIIDLALADNLKTRYRIELLDEDPEEMALLLADERCIIGLSDAGAHVGQLCGAMYSTDLLGHWVRERNAMSMERAIWRLTDQPARLFGIARRGRIAPGYFADLVAFDPRTVGAQPLKRVADLPAGADRLTAESNGVQHVWVNGVATRQNGQDLAGVQPGHLIRGIHSPENLNKSGKFAKNMMDTSAGVTLDYPND